MPVQNSTDGGKGKLLLGDQGPRTEQEPERGGIEKAGCEVVLSKGNDAQTSKEPGRAGPA